MLDNTVGFVINEQGHVAKKENMVEVIDATIDRMKRHGRFEMRSTIRVANKLAESEILLYINRSQAFPISGFPRRIFNVEKQGSRKFKVL
jgi:hypothetical protein